MREWQGLDGMAQHLAPGLEDVADHGCRHAAAGHLDRGLDHGQGETFDAEAVMGEVALFRLQQPAGQILRRGVLGQKISEAPFRQAKKLLVLPQRVVGIEADGAELSRLRRHGAALMAFSIS